jgi:hypothetical protein
MERNSCLERVQVGRRDRQVEKQEGRRGEKQEEAKLLKPQPQTKHSLGINNTITASTKEETRDKRKRHRRKIRVVKMEKDREQDRGRV